MPTVYPTGSLLYHLPTVCSNACLLPINCLSTAFLLPGYCRLLLQNVTAWTYVQQCCDWQ